MAKERRKNIMPNKTGKRTHASKGNNHKRKRIK
jgi:hypothetical protein